MTFKESFQEFRELSDLKILTLKLRDSEYKFDKLIFTGAVLFLLVIALYFIFSYNSDFDKNYYVSCPAMTGVCENPLYRAYGCEKILNGALCEKETLEPGFTIGTPPPFFVKHWNTFAWLVVVLAFIINHVIYNLKFKFKSLEF